MGMQRTCKKKKNTNNKTLKSGGKSRFITKAKEQKEIVEKMLEMLNIIKLFHWNTHSLSLHNATDKLYDSLNAHIDKFVEYMIGKSTFQVKGICHPCSKVLSQKEFLKRVESYKKFIQYVSGRFDPSIDADLKAICDDILGDFNQLLYFFRMN